MKIYFAGSIRAGREDAALYRDIISFLAERGEVLTEHVGGPGLSDAGQAELTDKFIHDRDLRWLAAADLVAAEVTTPSLGVGYEIGTAVSRGIPVVALFRPDCGRRLSAMIAGCENVRLIEYRRPAPGDLFEKLGAALDELFPAP